MLDEIERKEKLFTEYNSAELLEITVSFLENNEFEDDSIKKNFERYRVYAVKSFSDEGLLRKPSSPAKQMSWKQKSERKAVRQIEEQNTEKRPMLPRSKLSSERVRVLTENGIKCDSIVCFMCLGPHLRRECKVYSKDVPYRPNMELCSKVLKQGKFAFGFHPRESCKHGDNPKFGQLMSSKRREADKQSTDNWRTYKK